LPRWRWYANRHKTSVLVPCQTGGWAMRRTLDLLTWLLVVVAVPAVFCLLSPPDAEATLGVPACAGRPHAGPCRLCTHRGRATLPRVIDADNVRFVPQEARAEMGQGETVGQAGF